MNTQPNTFQKAFPFINEQTARNVWICRVRIFHGERSPDTKCFGWKSVILPMEDNLHAITMICSKEMRKTLSLLFEGRYRNAPPGIIHLKGTSNCSGGADATHPLLIASEENPPGSPSCLRCLITILSKRCRPTTTGHSKMARYPSHGSGLLWFSPCKSPRSFQPSSEFCVNCGVSMIAWSCPLYRS